MSRRSPAVAAALVAGAGTLVLLGYVAWRDVPAIDALQLVLLAVGTALAGALLSAVALSRWRSAPLAGQVLLVALTPMLAVAVGTWLGARLMFLSSHDAVALVVLLVAGATTAAGSAVVLGARVSRQSDDLRAVTRRLGDGDGLADGPPAVRELASLRSELAQADARLADAAARERALESSRRELIAWVSHDLRTPLAGIRAIAEALEDGVVDDPGTVRRYHHTLRAESDRLTVLVDDLFELAKAQAGVIRLEHDRIALGDLVSDALAGISPVASAKGVRLEGRLAGETPELVGSPPELLRALRNILENAVRHTPADGTVVVEAGPSPEGDGRAYVSVLDSGGGIPDDAMARIFDVGFRADPARGRDGGAGLGLAIARELVSAHRGEIRVVNEDGGARFTVVLPVGGDDPGTWAGAASVPMDEREPIGGRVAVGRPLRADEGVGSA